MHRFLVESRNVVLDKAVINDKTQIHHIKNVLHLLPGEKVILFDEKAGEAQAKVDGFSEEGVTFRLDGGFFPLDTQDARVRLTIGCALPKNCKMDDIVDTLTQVGVDEIIPLETARVVVKLDKDKKLMRLNRWRKIALSAAKQSQRRIVPVVQEIQSLHEVFSRAGEYDLKLIPHLAGKRRTLQEVLKMQKARSILALIGPEGDFSPQEVKAAAGVGFIPVTLGNLVFRVDTAAVAVASFIRLYEES